MTSTKKLQILRKRGSELALFASFVAIVVASAVAATIALSRVVQDAIRDEGLAGHAEIARTFASLSLEREDFKRGRLVAGAIDDLDSHVRQRHSIRGVRLWERGGPGQARYRVAYSSLPLHGITPDSGARVEVATAFAGMTPVRLVSPRGTRVGNGEPAPDGSVVEAVVPVTAPRGRSAANVLEIYLDYQPTHTEIAAKGERVQLILVALAGLALLALAPWVLRASRALAEMRRRRHTVLQRSLRKAIARRELFLEYQPKLELVSGRPAGVEALLRWHHPKRGVVAPMQFLPGAEETPVIQELTAHVIARAFEQHVAWRAAGFEVPVAINLSPANVCDVDLVDQVRALLHVWAVDPAMITFEITETAIMCDEERGERILTELADLGVRLSIDDFGTGTSSLARLERLPFHEMKIDRDFVKSLERSENPTLIRSMVRLAHELRLTVVAEGVESDALARRLAALGCDVAQGFYLSPPVNASRVREWLAHRGRPLSASGSSTTPWSRSGSAASPVSTHGSKGIA